MSFLLDLLAADLPHQLCAALQGTGQDAVPAAGGGAAGGGGVIKHAIDFVLHINVHLDGLIRDYGTWIYGILFLIVFCETGLVVTPFLPGDSLLFAAGALCGEGRMNFGIVVLVLFVAAVLGDAVNYWVGSRFRPIFKEGGRVPLVKPAHLLRTQQFFEKYGGKAIVIARFVPIVRTVAPFFAGLGTMEYRKFLVYNIAGAALWVGVCAGAGYFFGNLPWVQKNFSLVVLGIIVVSLVPIAVELILAKRSQAKK